MIKRLIELASSLASLSKPTAPLIVAATDMTEINAWKMAGPVPIPESATVRKRACKVFVGGHFVGQVDRDILPTPPNRVRIELKGITFP